MNNYSNNQTQMNNAMYSNSQSDNYNQLDDINQYILSNTDNKLSSISNNNNLYKNPNSLNSNSNILGTLSNDNLITMANSIDPSSLNGTNIDSNPQMYMGRKKNEDNSSLIKSLTKEIINNLKENNLSLYDNSSINSRSGYPDDNKTSNSFGSSGSSGSKYSSSSKNNLKKKNKKKDEDPAETLENFVSGESNPTNPQGYIQWFFDECFNYKDFIILFGIYFILSQEMIKDFIARYFSCLNPDDEGKIGVQGVILYGLILTVLYMVIRKIF